MKITILIGGKAGQGPNILSEVISQSVLKKGLNVFYSRDYQSLIRGGHNFNTITISDKQIGSNTSSVNILVCLDEVTEKIHSANVVKEGIVLKFISGNGNMFYAGVLFKILGLEIKTLEEELKHLKNFEENMKEAKKGFESEKRKIDLKFENQKQGRVLMNGGQTTAISTIKSGLEFYYAYPMTPATSLMMELGTMQLDSKNKYKVIEMENETAVALAAMGSSTQGKVVMVGTSGGGFDLMTEALSFTAMAEIPIVFYLAQRPGPGTGVATYTSQGDLKLALGSGHGEFSRVIVAPADAKESILSTTEAIMLSQKFRIPTIILTDKHLAESKYIFIDDSNKDIILTKSSVKLGERFNSYECDKYKDNIATEDARVIVANFDRRMKKQKEIEKEVSKLEMFKIHGNKNSKNLIISWGSTKGAILDALDDKKIDAKFLQIIYMEPFPSKQVLDEIKKAKKVLVVENNATSPLSGLIAEKTGFIVDDENKILRYDGRPFFSDELAEEIGGRVK